MMTEYDLGKVTGEQGEKGNGIVSIVKTGTSGLVDTYTITFDDGSTTTFTVTNGKDGSSADIVTSWSATLSDTKIPSEKLTKNSLDAKANTSHTHTKSQITDFPNLSSVATSGSYNDLSNKPTIPSKLSDLQNDSDFLESTDIANDLTTTVAGKVLDARQGKVLADLIGDAIAFINQ